MPVFLRQMLLSICPPGRAGRLVAHAKPYSDRAVPFHAVSVEYRHIPHLAPEDEYKELVAPWLPDTAILIGRRFASLALARLSGASSWSAAAGGLDLEKSRSLYVVNQLGSRIGDPVAFWEAVAKLSDRLRQRGLVDYQARRMALSGLDHVGLEVCGPLFRPHGMTMPVHAPRAVAAWLWCQMTSGQLRDAPAMRSPGWPLPRKSRTACCLRLASRMPEPLKDEMLVLGNELIRATTAPGTSPQFGPTARDTHRDGQSAERMA